MLPSNLINFINDKINEENLSDSEKFYQIGVEFKKLKKSEKNWQDLATFVNYPGSGEQYRSFVKNKQSQNDNLPINDLDFILSDHETFQDNYKETTKLRDVVNSYRSELRSQARYDNFKENFISCVKRIDPIEFQKNSDPLDNYASEAVLLISDLHLGVQCDNFYNKYNYDIAKKRMHKLAEETIEYCKKNNVGRLNVLSLGDLIQGNIHETSRIDAEFDIIEQTTKAAELMTATLKMLLLSGLNIVYRSCTDNHSRVTADYKLNLEHENFSRIIDWYVEAKFQNSNLPISFAHDNLDDSIGKFKLQNGKTVMFAHGHLENINKCIDNFFGATREFVDYVFLSHFHSSKEKYYNGSRLIVNGSIVGCEQYSISKRLFGNAEQKLIIFDRDNLQDITINLQEEKRP